MKAIPPPTQPAPTLEVTKANQILWLATIDIIATYKESTVRSVMFVGLFFQFQTVFWIFQGQSNR